MEEKISRPISAASRGLVGAAKDEYGWIDGVRSDNRKIAALFRQSRLGWE
jgi:hypothetical protein